MTDRSHQATATWQDGDFARSWARHDTQRDLLDFPRRIAAQLVADDNPGLALVIDIASGPGDFLAVFLEEFPAARGLWTDVSEPMLELARPRLRALGGRVAFQAADMTDLSGLPYGAGAVTSSRATHHLERAELLDFYAQAGSHLAPGGWLVNLDHVGAGEQWNARLRSARRRFVAPAEGGSRQHRHDHPQPTVQDHLDGYLAAGITDVQVVWRAFFTCLFMGRREM